MHLTGIITGRLRRAYAIVNSTVASARIGPARQPRSFSEIQITFCVND